MTLQPIETPSPNSPASARLADRSGGDARRYLLFIPLVMLVWVNSHGGFILAAPLFVAIAAGEAINRRGSSIGRRSSIALSPRAWRTLVVAWALSAAATIATPMGSRIRGNWSATTFWAKLRGPTWLE